MSRGYFFRRASDLSSHDLTNILVEIDNGFYDKIVDKNDWFDKLDVFREEVIEILLRRYRTHKIYNTNKDESLEKAYSLYLKHYI
jgi:hypothetical protein